MPIGSCSTAILTTTQTRAVSLVTNHLRFWKEFRPQPRDSQKSFALSEAYNTDSKIIEEQQQHIDKKFWAPLFRRPPNDQYA